MVNFDLDPFGVLTMILEGSREFERWKVLWEWEFCRGS
jgi:hypothetical protein